MKETSKTALNINMIFGKDKESIDEVLKVLKKASNLHLLTRHTGSYYDANNQVIFKVDHN